MGASPSSVRLRICIDGLLKFVVVRFAGAAIVLAAHVLQRCLGGLFDDPPTQIDDIALGIVDVPLLEYVDYSLNMLPHLLFGGQPCVAHKLKMLPLDGRDEIQSGRTSIDVIHQ